MQNEYQGQPIEVCASGAAIESALKIVSAVEETFGFSLHKIVDTKLHITEAGEYLTDANAATPEKLRQLMSQGSHTQEYSCKTKFEFAMHQRITPSIRIALSLEKPNTEDIGYHHPQVPLSAKKAQPAYMENKYRHVQQEQRPVKPKQVKYPKKNGKARYNVNSSPSEVQKIQLIEQAFAHGYIQPVPAQMPGFI